MTDNKNKSPSDFNDLQKLSGEDEVRKQLLDAVLGFAANDPLSSVDSSKAPPAPPSDGGRPKLETMLKRYAFVIPDGKVWDRSKQRFIKDAVFKKIVTEKLYKQWIDHDDLQTEEMEDISGLEASAQKEGGGGLGEALERYVYLNPSSSAWDRLDNAVVPMCDLRYAIADCYTVWLAHKCRAEIKIGNLVFEPANKVDPETHINMFTGIEMQPKENIELAAPIFMLASHLCNDQPETYKFLLDWIAFPLQFPGSKMASAILMHSETHGSGKSLFFERCVKGIYGKWAATLGQHQLESQYTDWRSNMLFSLFEEIFSRDQKYSHTGTIKHMITGETHRIEKKFVSGWEESNYMNSVFLSNEIQPFPLEPSDRRMLVIWPEKKLTDELNDAVMKSIENGGVEAFYHELMNRDLSGMTTHTEPPMTTAKEFLIDFGRATWDVFCREWVAERLDFPFVSCLHEDLFSAYYFWCTKRRERCMGQNQFSNLMSSRIRRRRDVRYQKNDKEKKGTIFQVGKKPQGKTQVLWLGEEIQLFKLSLKDADPNEKPMNGR